MKNHTFLLPLTLGTALILSACGGGNDDGGGSASQNVAATTTLSSITTANSTKVASNAYTGNELLSTSSASVTATLTGVSVEGSNISMVAPALGIINRAFSQGAPKLLTGVSTTQACSGGGSISMDATLSNQDTASNGDKASITLANCVENGATLRGAFTITLSGISGAAFDTAPWAATVDARFNSFSVTIGSKAVVANGDMKIAINQTASDANSVAISGKSFQSTETKSGVTVATRTLADYSVTGATRGGISTSAASFTVSGNTSALGQFAYSVKNVKPFVSTNGGAPTEGSLIAVGASSSVTMTVIDGGNVRLDYSAKGDGVITQTSTLSWADFIATI
jgi:hypothetical protein